MVKLRLTRMGRKKMPFYRIVAVDSRDKRDGEYIEKIGTYNPLAKKEAEFLVVNQEAALKWMMCGAQPTLTVKALFKKIGLMLKYDMLNKNKTEKVEGKVKTVRDAEGNIVKRYTAEEVEKAYQEWLKLQVAKKERKEAKKETKLSKKAKAKKAAEAKAAQG